MSDLSYIEDDGYNMPTNEEVYQAETPVAPTVPVEVQGPVQVDELPARSGGCFAVTASTAPLRLLGNDPRRKRAVVISIDQNIYIGNTSSQVLMPSGAALWPQDVALELQNSDEWWVAAASSTTTVTVIVENWAR